MSSVQATFTIPKHSLLADMIGGNRKTSAPEVLALPLLTHTPLDLVHSVGTEVAEYGCTLELVPTALTWP